MKEKKYLLIYLDKQIQKTKNKCFESKDDMKHFIAVNLSEKRYWKVLHKYKIEEVK